MVLKVSLRRPSCQDILRDGGGGRCALRERAGKPACTWQAAHFKTRDEIRCRRAMRGTSMTPGMDLKCVCVVRTVQRGHSHAELQKHAVS
eukprot:2394044-Prymnesium_polylepis.1